MAKLNAPDHKKLEVQLREEGYHNIVKQERKVNGQTVVFSFNIKGGLKVLEVKITAPVTDLITEAIKQGLVTKKNNWYAYNGKNYNGKAAILTALKTA